MPDREKVISHFQDAIEASGAGNGWRFVRVDMIEDAIALLRKQNAVEPREQEETRIWTVCGNCSQHLISKWLWCPYCGRKVQWE